MHNGVRQDKEEYNLQDKLMVRGENMAKIDVKFMKGTKVTAKKMGNTYKPKKRK